MQHDLTGAKWHKSSRSGANGGDCVEVAANLPRIVAVRDSKDAGGPAVVFSTADFGAFIAAVKDDRFS